MQTVANYDFSKFCLQLLQIFHQTLLCYMSTNLEDFFCLSILEAWSSQFIGLIWKDLCSNLYLSMILFFIESNNYSRKKYYNQSVFTMKAKWDYLLQKGHTECNWSCDATHNCRFRIQNILEKPQIQICYPQWNWKIFLYLSHFTLWFFEICLNTWKIEYFEKNKECFYLSCMHSTILQGRSRG